MKAEDTCIRIAIVGLGSMGKGLLFQSQITPGITCAAICDLKIERCIQALEHFGLEYAVVSTLSELHEAFNRKIIGVCSSSNLIAEYNEVDAVIEASSSIGAALPTALLAMERGKHLILMNSELDLMFGPLLQEVARQRGVVCTSCDGDQYGALKHLIDDIKSWGFELVMAGNIKGYLDRYATPSSIVIEADKRSLDYRMCTSYTDGTKLNIEMAIIANTFDLTISETGMAGPKARHVNEIFDCFDFARLYEDRRPIVDYILGAQPGGGVFVVGYCEAPYQRSMLSYYKMGEGPFYLFYRPYHLCHIESMQVVRKAVKLGETFMGPSAGLKTNVFAYAKRDLPEGTVLDGIGGFDCYGHIEVVNDHASAAGLPICLAENVILTKSISKDQRITLTDVVYAVNRSDFKLYEAAKFIRPSPAT